MPPDEIVEFGRGRPRRRRPWLTGLLVACLAAAAIVKLADQHGHDSRPPPPPAVSVSRVGHRLLGVTAGWQLFGLSQDGLVSVQFARGLITRTTLPPPEGSGPVSFIAGPRQAIVRPLDDVPGYLVPAGQPARPLTGPLGQGSQLLPGPVAGQEWAVTAGENSLTLFGPDGRPAGPRITLPADRWVALSAMSDGRGGVLVSGVSGGQYDATPHSVRPVGALLAAVGPTRWLGVTCERRGCRNVVINPAAGTRRILPGPALQLLTWPFPYEPGAVAPDGATAAVVVGDGSGGGVALTEINLASGATTPIAVPVTEDSSSQTIVWSPDSKWLFVVAADGRLVAVNAATGRPESLGVPLPEFSELAVAPAAR